jgi:hypothetical protein
MSAGFNEEKIAAAPEIRRQLFEARQKGAAYMIRLQNRNTGEITPLLVQRGTPPRYAFAAYIETHGMHFDPIECYDMDLDLENQVLADRTVNWDKTLPVQTGPYTPVVPWDGLGPNPQNPPTEPPDEDS